MLAQLACQLAFAPDNTEFQVMVPVAYLMALIVIFLSIRPSKVPAGVILSLLGVLNLWMGFFYALISLPNPGSLPLGAFLILVMIGSLLLINGLKDTKQMVTLNTTLLGPVFGLIILAVSALGQGYISNMFPEVCFLGLPPVMSLAFTVIMLLATNQAGFSFSPSKRSALATAGIALVAFAGLLGNLI